MSFIKSVSKPILGRKLPIASLNNSCRIALLNDISCRFFFEGKILFPQYTIFRPQCILRFTPVPPQLQLTKNDSYFVKKNGAILLNFVPSRERSNENKYDNEKREMFALQIHEIGEILNYDGQSEVKWMHDYVKENSSFSKILVLQRKNASGIEKSGYTFQLSVISNNEKQQEQQEQKQEQQQQKKLSTTKLSITLHDGDFTILKTLLRYSVPRLLGWNYLSVHDGIHSEAVKERGRIHSEAVKEGGIHSEAVKEGGIHSEAVKEEWDL